MAGLRRDTQGEQLRPAWKAYLVRARARRVEIMTTRNRLALAASLAIAAVFALWFLAGPKWAGVTTLAGLAAMRARQVAARRGARAGSKSARVRDRAERRDVERRQEASDAAAEALVPPAGSTARLEAYRAADEAIERGEV